MPNIVIIYYNCGIFGTIILNTSAYIPFTNLWYTNIGHLDPKSIASYLHNNVI